MANKRQLKKRIDYVCSELAYEFQLAACITPEPDFEAIADIVHRLAALQNKTRARVNFSFDKTPAEFETPRQYAAARRAYNKAAYERLREDYSKALADIIKDMNRVVPAESREAIYRGVE